MKATKRNPWAWIPTLYFAQGIPYVAVNVITVIMYKRLGISNADIALYTGWLYLPWVIKPFWSPFVDIIKTKRWWTLLMQWIIGFGLAAVAFAIPTPIFFQLTLAIFWLVGFASATHDIASDGFYMIALKEHEQAAYVGIRSTFYRVATIVGQGLLVIIAGVIESNTGLEPTDLTLNIDPSLKASAVYTIPNDIVLSNDQLKTEQFIFSSPAPTATATLDSISVNINNVEKRLCFSDFYKLMVDSVYHMNLANGFVPKLEEDKDVEKDSKNDFSERLKTRIHELFGENREIKNVTNTNFVIVGIRLSQLPKEGDERILTINYSSGDQSIKINEKNNTPRFVFTKDNWDKTAYLIFDLDKNIKTATTATFKGTSGNIPFAWLMVFLILSIFFLAVAIYHSWALPTPSNDKSLLGGKQATASEIFRGFAESFRTFFQKKQIWIAMAFMLLYRLPEAQLIKIINPFFLDPIDKGGLGLTTSQVGLVYGTIGIIGLTIGGIIGGIVASRGGLKKWLWPMALSISLNSIVYIYLSAVQPDASTFSGMATICGCMFLDQFGYGFGFTAFMLFMMYFADGPLKTSHYAICTAFMALGMMLPGMWSGWLEEALGYNHFFIWTLLCCLATWSVTALIKVDPNYGKKAVKGAEKAVLIEETEEEEQV